MLTQKMVAIIAAGALAACLGLAACGGSASSSAASSSAASSSAASAATTTSSAAASSAAPASSTAASQSASAAAPSASAATPSASASASAAYIGEEAAKDIALKDSGFSAGDVTELKAELDLDDAVVHYDVDFKQGGKEYDYDIDATTGAIIQAKSEIDD